MQRKKSLLHRLFILFIILLLPTFFIREYRLIKSKKDTRILPIEDFSFLEVEEAEEKAFTFIVLTLNNEETIERNFQSIQKQNYLHFQLIYLDQGSTDKTVRYLKERGAKVIECEDEAHSFKKYYEIVSNLPDDEVIVHLYGTDYLAHEDVLPRLSRSYANPDVWLTYGQYFEGLKYEKGMLDPKPKKTLYKKRVQRAPWVVAPLKTFYAGLFKKLHVEEGFFLSIKDENALLIPLAELAKAHVRFIPDVLFIHNENRKRERRRFTLKSDPTASLSAKKGLVDLVVFSENTPDRLYTFLQEIGNVLPALRHTQVIYLAAPHSQLIYEQVRRSFPRVTFTQVEDLSLKEAAARALWGGGNPTPYVIVSTDRVSLQNPMPLSHCIAAMRKVGADVFYLGQVAERDLSKQSICEWRVGEYPSGYEGMVLYRRLGLEQTLKHLPLGSISDLLQAWTSHTPRSSIGLSFEHPQ